MSNKVSELFQKLMQNSKVKSITNQMYNSMGSDAKIAFAARPNLEKYSNFAMKKELLDALTNNPEVEGATMGDIMANAGTAKDLGALTLGAAKAHPFKTAGLIGLGASNIGGLTDGNGIGGQLAGLGLGGLGAYALAQGNPYTQAMMTMGGGALGSLFDKLRAQKELEQEQQAQFYR